MKCALCGTENPTGMRFCGGCAARLTLTGQAAAPDRLPGDLSPATLSTGERRLVTILFADVSGFTALSETLDPEEVRDLITACFDRLVPCIQRNGGTIDKFMGDEIMALFGAPIAYENDPERALRAALEMREALVGFNRDRGVSLALHFGVNTGVVYAGGLGGGGRQDYSVMGDPVNVAARLRATAEPGEIIVGVDTFRHARDEFSWDAVEPLSVKGRSAPLTAYLLLDTHTVPAAPRETLGLGSPLVGREDDLASIMHRFTRLHEGEGGVVVITGEPGLGKSRLVAEARARPGQHGLTWLEGHTLSFGHTLSYWPLLEIIQSDAGIDSDDTESERWGKLAGRVTSLFGEETPGILPYLATLLSLPLPEDLAQIVRHLDGETMGRQVYRATRLFFARLAQERPTVLVFEDVHWLDGSSAALIEHLLPLTREVPLVFCLVARPETGTALTRLQDRARADYADRLTEIALSPLSHEESAVLVRNLVQVRDLPGRTREAILAKAEGNPFFVEEVVRSLIDLGGLVQADSTGHWQVTESAASITIPDTLHGVIMARVDRLDDDLKRVLRLASVVGRTFFYRVLAAVAEADQRLDESLAALEARDLIREHVRVPEVEYIFKHALVQEATYQSILLQLRRDLHARVARAIEALFPDRGDEFLGLLAYHYTKAEDWEKAQDYLLAAGRQAGMIAADPETLAHFEQALEAHLRAHGGTWGDLISDEGIDWFLDWTDALGEAHRLGSVVTAIKAFYDSARAVMRAEDPRSMALATILAKSYLQSLAPAAAEVLMEEVLAAPEGVEPREGAALLRSLYCLGIAKLQQDKFSEAEAILLRALGRVHRSSELSACPEHSQLCYVLGATYLWTGRFAEGKQAMIEGLASPGLRPGWARDSLLINLSMTSWVLGDYAEAERYALACLEQTTHPGNQGAALDNLGLVCLSRGDLAESVEHLAAAVRLLDAFGDPADAETWSDFAEALLRAGRVEEAERTAKYALALVGDLADHPSASINPFWALAGVALVHGDLNEAERLLRESETVLVKSLDGRHYLVPEILHRKAQLRRRQGRDEEAEELLAEACRLLDERRGSPHPRAEAMRAEWAGM